MRRALIVGGALGALLVVVALAAGYRTLEQIVAPVLATSPAITPLDAAVADETQQGFLYGRITTVVGTTYEGRLRWGGGEEAFWSDYFNGFKDENPWAAHVPLERLQERRPIEVFGLEIGHRERQINLGRPLMVRFGDVARIHASGRDLLVTLKSGTVFELDRFSADDFADGVHVWDDRRGVVALDEWWISTIELLPTARLSATPGRLHGTVHTEQGSFTGFLQWDRVDCVGSDELFGHSADGEHRLRFDTIRSIVRRSIGSSLVTLLDGRELVLSGSTAVGHGNRGTYVDDRRYGRVLVSWHAFERVDFSAVGGASGSSGPAYDDFLPGNPLMGSVTTRNGRRLAGRLVYDLDESETTETLDAPAQGVTYTIPFGLIAAIVIPDGEERGAQHARVMLHSGEELLLELAGDLGPENAGLLIFADGGRPAEHVAWADVAQVELSSAPTAPSRPL